MQRLNKERADLYASKSEMSSALQKVGDTSQEQADTFAYNSARKDLRAAELSDLVQDLHAALAVMQEGYIAQTKEFRNFVKAVRQQEAESLSNLKESISCLMAMELNSRRVQWGPIFN